MTINGWKKHNTDRRLPSSQSRKQASAMTYLSGTHLVWVLLIPVAVSSLKLLSYPEVPKQAAVSSPRLTSYPDEATQGEEFTLSCEQDQQLLKATWNRNSDAVFITKPDTKVPVVDGLAQSSFNVLGRITVSSSYNQHNVTLRINSTMDDGSVWLCGQADIYSNNLTIHVIQHTTVVSTSQTTTLQNVQTSTSTDSSVDTTKDVQSKKTNTLTAGLSTEQNGAHSDITSSPAAGLSTEQNVDELFGDPFIDKNLIYIVIGSVVGAVVVSVIIVTVVCVIRKKRNQTAQPKCPTPKEHSSVHEEKDGVDNSEMIDNVLYCGYSDPQYSTGEENRSNEDNKAQTSDETRVTDVYAQVQKKKNQTKVQVTVNIEDLYAKPVRKKSEDTANISVNNNVNINIGNIADESV